MIGADRIAQSALALLGEPAVRATALAIIVASALSILRVKRASVRLGVWTIVLYAAIAMPALDWALPGIPLPMPTAAPFHAWSRPQPAADLVSIPEPPAVSLATHVTSPAVESARVLLPDAPARPTREVTSVSWPVIGMSIYLIFAALLLLRAIAGWIATTRVERCAQPIDDAILLARVRQTAPALGVRRIPRLADTDVLLVPMTTSVFRPMIVLPSDWRGWDSAKMDAVLAHELAHVARRDLLTQRLSVLFRIVFCFSPLSWWLRRRLVDLAEQASDEAALEAGAERTAYAETLLGFVNDIQGEGHRARWHVAMAGGADAERRVERILTWKRGVAVNLTKSLVVGIVTASTFAVVLAASVTPVWRSNSPIAVTTAALRSTAEAAVPTLVPFAVSRTATAMPRPSAEPISLGAIAVPVHGLETPPAAISDVEVPKSAQTQPAVQPVDAANGPLTTAQLAGHRVWAMLFDVSSMSPSDSGKAADSAIKWASEKMTDADVVLIASTTTQINLLLDFTSNKEKVIKTLNTFAAAQTPEAPLVGNWPASATDPAPVDNDIRLRAMRTICDGLKPYQQKKSLLYFSGGMRRSGTDNQAELRAATSACSKANVVIDPIDSRGLQAVKGFWGIDGVSGGVHGAVTGGIESGVSTGVSDGVVSPDALKKPAPDFSGTWAFVSEGDLSSERTLLPTRNANSARTLMGLLTGLCEGRCEIVQDARTIKFTRDGHGGPTSFEYVLDGVARKTALPSSGADMGTEWTTEAGWVSDTIVITITEVTKLRGGGERRVETRYVLAQTGGGGMSLETTVTDTQGAKPVPIMMRYVKNG